MAANICLKCNKCTTYREEVIESLHNNEGNCSYCACPPEAHPRRLVVGMHILLYILYIAIKVPLFIYTLNDVFLIVMSIL
jgi:hypothetical protein